jgi:Conserved in the green lineage and diatoms 27
MSKTSLSVCPVPSEQQPLNEYEQLKESPFFCWTTLEGFAYARKLIWVWVWGWAIAGPIAAASFPPERYPLRFALAGGGGALVFVVLLLVRLYLGWFYVRDRLNQETVFYEESGWYDGQAWPKPPEMLTRDRLIVTYQVQPILNRLKQTFGAIAIPIGVGSMAWLVF